MQRHTRMTVVMQQTTQTMVALCHSRLEQCQFQWYCYFDVQTRLIKSKIQSCIYIIIMTIISPVIQFKLQE